MDSRSSKKQQELLQFIDGFIKGNGYGPSYREVMRALGYKSVSTVAVHVDGLIAKGYLRKKDHSARSIEVVTLRGDVPKAEVRADMAEGVQWLETEIDKRIKKDDDNKKILSLIEAADILGSDKAEALRERLAKEVTGRAGSIGQESRS